MTKKNIYTYLGTNGTIVSPVFLEGIYCVKKVQLVADKERILTKDYNEFKKFVLVPEVEVNDWIEVDEAFGQK